MGGPKLLFRFFSSSAKFSPAWRVPVQERAIFLLPVTEAMPVVKVPYLALFILSFFDNLHMLQYFGHRIIIMDDISLAGYAHKLPVGGLNFS